MELGNYPEQIFLFIGVWFISVNDNYDSVELADGTNGDLDVAFKNLIYDYYSKEMSRNSGLRQSRAVQFQRCLIWLLEIKGNKCPKEEWVRVENIYEPIVTYSQYIKAVSSLKQRKAAETI